MPRREVNDVEVLDVRDLGEHGMACTCQLQHFRAWDRAAHQGGPDFAAGTVGEFDPLAKHGPGLRDGPAPETLKDLCAQAFEARLLCEYVERGKRKLLHVPR